MQSEEQKIAETGEGYEQDSTARSNRTRMLAVRHVAQLLGIHESTVRMWADSNVLESYRIGPRQDRRIPMKSVLRVLKAARNWPHYGPAKKHEEGTAAPQARPLR